MPFHQEGKKEIVNLANKKSKQKVKVVIFLPENSTLDRFCYDELLLANSMVKFST